MLKNTFTHTIFILLMLFSIDTAWSEQVKVPINVGLGPAAYNITGKIADKQQWHWGGMTDIAAVIDKATIARYKDKIPSKYRALAKKTNEAKIHYLWIPESIYLSPSDQGFSVFGASWRPIAVGFSSFHNHFHLGSGFIMTYLYIKGQDPSLTTHFLRPGLDLKAEFTFNITGNTLISFGWKSNFYLPQEIGSFGIGNKEDNIWHIGQPFLLFHYRFPYKVNI